MYTIMQNSVLWLFMQKRIGAEVFHKIRNDILNGRYKEHEELKEIRIGKELGVSRTPVREALRQLELEGLVQIIPNRGAFVTGIQENDVRDIYAIRALLEGLCARWATERITPEQLEDMEENVYLAEFHAGKGHMEQIAELDNIISCTRHAGPRCWSTSSWIIIPTSCGSAGRRFQQLREALPPIKSTERSWKRSGRERQILQSGLPTST